MASRSNREDAIRDNPSVAGCGSRGAMITEVAPGSIADELGLRPGDRLVSINGHKARDLLEYSYLTQTSELRLEVARGDDEIIMCDIEKDEDEDLGISFADALFNGTMQCSNNCLFCFIRQNPRGVRPSLCVRDDDPRLSFFHGNYISLTNLSNDHFNMLLKMRLSPLYVSVHSTDPAVRKRLMGYKRDIDIISQLSALVAAGTTVHCQIVLCPGINDGSELTRTVDDLHRLHPGVASVAVVPVGLTSHREHLPPLRRPDRAVARETLAIVERLQEHCLKSSGTRFVFASDEFYFLADMPFPEGVEYEEYQQIENGVGLTRKMYDEFKEIVETRGFPTANGDRPVSLITGVLGAKALKFILSVLWTDQLKHVHIHAVENSFFGSPVTVTGLLCGRDVLRGIEEMRQALGSLPATRPVVVIPDVMVNVDGLFVDDLSLEQVRKTAAQLGVDLRVVNTSADGLYCALATARE